MEERTARLEERVERIQVDVTDIKADSRRMDGKIDAVRDSVAALHIQMKDGFASSEEKIAALNLKLTEADGKTATALALLEARLQASIASLGKARMADRVWWLLISAGILTVMARAFGWF